MANSGPTSTAAERARKTAEKYSGEGQSFNVKYLGTQEVSSAKGDAVIADCLKELRTLFKDVAAHLPKVTITLQLSGITVVDEKSKLETIKVPLDHISYVCLDPGDSSVFSFIIRCSDTISSKGLRLHAFVCHPEIAITFNRSARELFDFMSRVMKAKKKIAQQQEEKEAKAIDKPTVASVQPKLSQDVIPLLLPPPTVTRTDPPVLDQSSAAVSLGLSDEEKSQQAVFDEWKQLEQDINDIEKGLGIIQDPATSTPSSSQATAISTVATNTQMTQPSITTMNGSNPFDNSFFDLSFGAKESFTSNYTPSSAVSDQGTTDIHLFDNPIFNGHPKKTEPAQEPELAMPLNSSTPDQSKQLVYSSRPRPKGKVLDKPTIFSPPPVPNATTTTDGSDSRVNRDVSLSPTGEQEVKDILANTDPFSPTTLNDANQFTPSSNSTEVPMNGSGMFQPPGVPFSPNSTPNSAYFSGSSSILAQDSIQLINPLYTPNGSFTAAPFSPPSQQQTLMPVVMMSPPPMQQQQPFVTAIPQPIMMQPAPLVTQMSPDIMGMPINSNGMLPSSQLSSPPPMQTGNPNLSPSSHSTKALVDDNKDKMFADLLPSTAHPISEKKKEFEPQNKKPVQPTLAQLQENKKKEQEQAFKTSTSVIEAQTTKEESIEWPPSPFDAPSQPNDLFDSLLEGSSLSSTGEQVSLTQSQQNAMPQNIIPQEDFDVAFEKASSKESDIASAFDTKTETLVGPKVATNDPFSPTDKVSPPIPKEPNTWSIF